MIAEKHWIKFRHIRLLIEVLDIRISYLPKRWISTHCYDQDRLQQVYIVGGAAI